MKKRTPSVCALLTASLLLSLAPQTVFAAEEDSILSYDFRNQDTDVSGDGWDWDASGRILSLDGLYLQVSDADHVSQEGAICLPEDSILYLDGDSEILVDAYGLHAIYAEGDLSIRGNHDLIVSTSSASASVVAVHRGDITIEDGAFLEVYPAGYVLYVTGAKGKDGVVNIYDTAKVEVHDPYDDNFYDIDTDHLVYVTYRSPAKPTDAWLNFSEEYDRDYETITFSKKTTADASDSKEDTDADEDTDKDTAETPESVTTQTHTYTIRIGNTMIAKDGAPAYQGDVPAYLSEAGYTMLPLRALLSVSQEDVDIDWNQAEKTATIQWGDTTAVIQENNRTMVVNGKTVALINPAETVQNRMFLSLRDWSALLQLPEDALQWDSASQTVTLVYETTQNNA